MEDEKGMHDGHRKRLIDLVDRVGIENVTKIQALEFILFYVFPRGDVNPLAHRLLSRFHDVATVLEASVEDLCKVKGMGETSAKKLRSLLYVFLYYAQEKLEDNKCLKTLGDFYDYIEEMLRYCPEEQLYLFGINPNGEITKGRKFSKGLHDRVEVSLSDLTLYISTYRVSSLILVHNHPRGICKPSTQDQTSFVRMKEMFKFSGFNLVDSVIVGNDGIYSMDKACRVRIFSESLSNLTADSQESSTEKLLGLTKK